MATSSSAHVESPRAREAWADYLALGDDRSLEKLLARYQTASTAPSRRLKTLADWSRHFDWQGRLKRLADDAAKAVEDAYQAERQAVLSEGLALDHKRVHALKGLGDRLLDDYQLWVPTIKLAANGDQVEVQEFNAAELRELRGVLDDIAKETGGRQSKVDITSGGEPIKGYVGIDPDKI